MVVEDVVEDGSLLTVEEEALLLRKCRLNKVELVTPEERDKLVATIRKLNAKAPLSNRNPHWDDA